MNNRKQHPWFGLDDLGAADISFPDTNDPKPLYNEKSQQEQDKALLNPEQSIDKDPEKPWVQGKDSPEKPPQDSGVNPGSLPGNGGAPSDGTKDGGPKPK